MPGHWKLNLNTKASRFIEATLLKSFHNRSIIEPFIAVYKTKRFAKINSTRMNNLGISLASSVISKTISWLSEEKLKIFPQNRRVSVLRQNVLENVKPGDAVATIEVI
ncbi:hypothetical protein T06_3517 [Trichinella sp. T6]|nr:hypothetical protein T06_3517 [Trichinella sp. T6]